MDLRVKYLLILVAGILCVGIFLLAAPTLAPPAGTPGDIIAKPAVTAVPALAPPAGTPGDITAEPAVTAVPTLAPPVDTPGNLSDEQAVVAANNRFAVDLYRTLAGDTAQADQNIFFSPSSISTAFAITAEGARGRTHDEIQTVFHLPADPGVVRNGSSRIYAALNAPGAGYIMSTANALYAEKTYRFLPEYISAAQMYYHANATNMDFIGHPEESRQFINRQVEEQTRGRIHNILPAGSINDVTRLVITNAIYFKGTWSNKFDEAGTRDDVFHTASGRTLNVPMMHIRAHFPYMETDEYQAIALPYDAAGGRPVSMLVLLPRENNPAGFEANLSPESIAAIRKDLAFRNVQVSLPRFTMDTSYNLNDFLPGMGMPAAFDAGAADFSGMDGSHLLYIGGAFHKAFVEVNENGTEATAATVGYLADGASPNAKGEPLSFVADHPFVFMILDDESGNILFMGRVTAPSQVS